LSGLRRENAYEPVVSAADLIELLGADDYLEPHTFINGSDVRSPSGRFGGSRVGARLAQPIAWAKAGLSGPVVRNAASLYGATVITSFLGFAYWFAAARMVPAEAIGIASAIQSAARFISIFCVLGLSTLLISELSGDRRFARTLVLTAAAAVGVFTLVVSGIVGIVLGSLSTSLRPGFSDASGIIVFVLLSVFTTIMLLMDDACIGLLRGDLQLKRNTVFAVSKLLLLPLFIVAWRSPSGTELQLAWLCGIVISLIFLGRRLGQLTRGESARLDFRGLIAKRRLMLGHHSLNVSVASPGLVMPVLVATIVGAKANAAYTVAMLVAGFVNIIPFHLATVLFAIAPGDEATLSREVKRSMKICLAVALVSAPFFLLSSSTILSFFGPSYEVASTALIVLGFTTYPIAIKAHYVAISRVRGKMQQAALLTLIGALLEVGLGAVGAATHGVTGVAVGLLTALLMEAALFSPVVVGVLRAPRMPLQK
jgi:O-antigen/teichoic acid export membrane protein